MNVELLNSELLMVSRSIFFYRILNFSCERKFAHSVRGLGLSIRCEVGVQLSSGSVQGEKTVVPVSGLGSEEFIDDFAVVSQVSIGGIEADQEVAGRFILKEKER